MSQPKRKNRYVGDVARILAGLLCVVVVVSVSATRSEACSCERPPESVNSFDDHQKWMFERAVDVVQGRITEIRADASTVREGVPVVAAKMKATKVVKGSVALGDLTLVTDVRSSCGIPNFLLQSVASETDVVIEVRKVADGQNEYWVSFCGYGARDSAVAKARPVN